MRAAHHRHRRQQAPQTDAPGTVVQAPVALLGMPGHLIRRMHQAAQAIFDTEIVKAGFDLTSVQFAALTVIAARPGLDQARLASAIAFDRVTTGGVIDRLEAKGFVRREIAQGDRRSRRLHVEPAGARVLARVTPVVERAQEMILAGLAATEKATLMRLLEKALQAVGDVSRSAPRSAPGSAPVSRA
jgi:DNA-binding MarR family transcriptional regulator